MDLAVVLWTDRHSDPGVYLFTDPAVAIEWAKKQAKAMDRHGDSFQEIPITNDMARCRWIYLCNYSCEGDGLRVMMVTVDKDIA